MYVFTQIKIITLTEVQKHFYEESWLARIILCLDGFLCQLNFDTYTKSSHFQPKIQSFLCKGSPHAYMYFHVPPKNVFTN